MKTIVPLQAKSFIEDVFTNVGCILLCCKNEGIRVRVSGIN